MLCMLGILFLYIKSVAKPQQACVPYSASETPSTEKAYTCTEVAKSLNGTKGLLDTTDFTLVRKPANVKKKMQFRHSFKFSLL